MRRTPLARRTPLTNHPRPRKRTPAEVAWKTPRWGRCQNCGMIDDRPLHGHHVIPRRYLAGASFEFDPRNRMDLCERCHLNHEYGQKNRKIHRDQLPAAAIEFAYDVLGPDRAERELHRFYFTPEGESD